MVHWLQDRITLKSNLLYAFKGAPQEVPALPEGLVFAEMDAENLARFFSSEEDTARRLRYERFLTLGHRGFMVHDADRWAAVGWVVPADVRGMPSHLPASITTHPWLSEAHTRPAYRGRGLHKFLLTKRLAILAEEDPAAAVTAMSDVAPQNVASRRSHLSVGFEPAGWVRSWKVQLPRLRVGPRGWKARSKPHPPL